MTGELAARIAADPPRIAKSGRSFDFAGYRVRLEARHGDELVPEVVAHMVGALTARGHDAREIPEALGDEDGESYVLIGHVDPCAAVLAVVLDVAVNVGAEDAGEALIGGIRLSPVEQAEHARDLVRNVKHSWWRADPEVATDWMTFCTADAEGAEPITRVELG